MRRAIAGVLVLVAGVAIGFAASQWMARDGRSAPAPAAPTAPDPRAAAPEAVPAPPPDALPPEAKQYPEHFADLKREETAEPGDATLALPVLEKLVREPLSDVRHRVIGAWDEARESDAPGREHVCA